MHFVRQSVAYILHCVLSLRQKSKQNTNSTDPRRSLKSATKTMRITSIYKKEEWTADEIRENITNLFGNDEIGNDYANNLIEMLAQTDDTENRGWRIARRKACRHLRR